MDKPNDLIVMTYEIAWRSNGDEAISMAGQVEDGEPSSVRASDGSPTRTEIETFDSVADGGECVTERIGQVFSAASEEWNGCCRDDYAHAACEQIEKMASPMY